MNVIISTETISTDTISTDTISTDTTSTDTISTDTILTDTIPFVNYVANHVQKYNYISRKKDRPLSEARTLVVNICAGLL